MGNRILKESIRTSEEIAKLSMGAEILFYRLIVSVDDYGAYFGNPEIVKNTCFPLKGEKLKVDKVEAWLHELSDAGLVILYEVGGKRYLQLRTWSDHQRIRTKKRKFPEIPDGCGELQQIAADCSKVRPESNPNPIQVQSESESNPNPSDVARVVDAWNSLGLTKVERVVSGTQREQFLKKRIQEYGMADVLRAIGNIPDSDFLMGNNARGWKITFDWLIRPNNFVKVLEGNYTNSRGTNNPFLKVWEEEYGQAADH